MYRLHLKLSSRRFVEFQAWLDENIVGWKHNTTGMSWTEHKFRCENWLLLYGDHPNFNMGRDLPHDVEILVPSDIDAVLVILTWNAVNRGIRGRPVLGFEVKEK